MVVAVDVRASGMACDVLDSRLGVEGSCRDVIIKVR